MTIGQAPICIDCVNDVDLDKKTCKAFPNGIPEKIWSNESLHLKPMAGDDGVIFTPDPDLGDYDYDLFWEGHPDLKHLKGKDVSKSATDGNIGFTGDTEGHVLGADDVLIYRTHDRPQAASHVDEDPEH